MKKLFASLLAAFLMTAGLAVVTTTTAGSANAISAATSAAGAACPYTGCVATRFVVAIAFDAPRPGKVRVRFRVRTLGNAVPSGRVRVIIRGREYRSRAVPYPGNTAMSFFRLDRGRYSVVFRFIPEPGTAFARSSAFRQVRVR